MTLLYTALICSAVLLTVIFIYRHYRTALFAWLTGFPQPRYRITRTRNFMLPMQDGTKLATDIYRPKSRWKYPVIIIRTPYNKSGKLHPYRQMAELFASQGYVVIVQDIRGKFRSEGKFYPYAYEALDGHTTITWAGEAPWSNGKVAMIGVSYMGSCAWLAARYKSLYLRTIIPMFTCHNTYSVFIDKGVPYLKGPLYWLSKHTPKYDNPKLTQENFQHVLWKLPVNELDILATQHKIPFFRECLAHTSPDSFWDEIGAHHIAESLDIPALLVGGWYDPFLSGTIDDFQRMIEAPETSKNHQSRMYLGPWGHNPGQRFKGLDFGKNASFNNLLGEILDWCDIWLKENKPLKGCAIRYFVMGKNAWRESDQWPPPAVSHEKMYLEMESGRWSRRNGSLSWVSSNKQQKSHYLYNPRDPLLFKGSEVLDKTAWVTPILQDEILVRDDVLVYTSQPLNEELTVIGAVKLVVYVSSTAFDTDFCAKICDVHPNGKTYNIASAFLRMRFRNSLDKPELMIPGTIYRVEIVLRPAAITFLKSHRIQLQIASADFPLHPRNLNTGMSNEYSTEMKEVEQTVYTGGEHDSHLILPVFKTE